VPPLSIAMGMPAKITKIFDQSSSKWRSLNDFGLPPEQALARHVAGLQTEEEYKALMKEKYPTVLVPKVAAGLAAGEI
jgi:hypothetical protein